MEAKYDLLFRLLAIVTEYKSKIEYSTNTVS